MAQAAAMARVLAVALWVGGTAALDFVEAPLRFASNVIDRNQAVGLGQLVISRWIRIEWALGVLAVIAALAARAPRWSVWLTGTMLAVAVVQGAFLAPAITRLAQGLDFVHRLPQDPRYGSIRQLHTAYAVLELFVLAAGALVLVASVRVARR